MTTISSSTQQSLNLYEALFNDVNQGTLNRQAYPGSMQLVDDYDKISSAYESDIFFAKYGVGNATSIVHNPFERQRAYELLLKILKSIDPVKYQKIHKGTPFYFIGWTTYQYRDLSKAIFYMDAAVSEDLKFPDVQSKASTRPALDFFLLSSEPGPTGLSTHLELRNIIDITLQTYNTNGGGTISIDDFRNRFVVDLLYSGPKERSLLTALYTFLLEYQEKENQISLRSDTGGSIQPFLDHLFDGARVLESLLEKRGGTGNTLNPKIVNASAIAVNRTALKSNNTLADAELEFNNQVAAGSSFQDSNFASAYIIRNTTGHSLLWPDQFANVSSYTTLYNNLVNSIFWTIEKLWLKE
ncbi:MAG: hypothetical protein KG003_13730 [Bacteroidetes bacterium]|nr:hypothetical protein [Bacteroidota bacterium]